ncbi:MAG: hypothetical protein E7206_10380 [Clostridium beijerinckii]|nr:hypothetical protein [Clostridium beijerinckii]
MVVCNNTINELLKSTQQELDSEKEGICIMTTDNDFDKELQIGSDSIDLRISNKGYIVNSEYTFINTLSDINFKESDYFIEVNLDVEKGYDLQPGQVLFINTLERVQLKGNLIGEIMGRSVFSRFGLSVHCTQSKFASGMNSTVPLQIRNNVSIPLRIFPYQKLAQLIIHRTEQNRFPYTGQYSSEIEYKLPLVSENDRKQYSERNRNIIKNIKPTKRTLKDKYGNQKTTKYLALCQTIAGVILSVFISFMGIFGVSTMTILVSIISVLVYITFSISIVRFQE